MKTLFKIFGGLILLVLVLMIGIGIYARYFFDANDLRGRITQLVEKRTGQTLAIEGDLELSVFPWVRVDVGRTTLSDAPEFGEAPLLVFDSASASVKFKPLLSRQLELGTTTVEGAQVTLTSLKDGRNNWEQFIGKLQADPANAAVDPAEEEEQFSTRSLGAINLKNATINYTDRAAVAGNQTLSFSEMNLTTGELKPDTPFGVSLDTKVAAENVALNVDFAGELTLSEEVVGIVDPKFEVSGTHYVVPFGNFSAALTGSSADVGPERASLSDSTVTWTLNNGQEAAQTVTSTSGKLVSTKLLWSGESIEVLGPNVELDATLRPAEGGVTQATSEFTGTSLMWDGRSLSLLEPELDLDAKLSGVAADSLKAKFIATSMQGELNQLKSAGVKLSGRASGADVPEGSQDFELASPSLTLDIENGGITNSAYTAKLLDLQLSGEIEGSQLFDSPSLKGPITIAPFNARDVMTLLGEAPLTTDPQAFAKAGGSAAFAYGASGLTLNNLKLVLDDSHIEGSVTVAESGQTVDLRIDKINADRYLAPPDEADAEARAVDVIEVPADQLRALNVNGRLRIGKLKFSGIESTDVDVTLASGNGKVRVHPVKATLYGGSYSGDIRVDAAGEVPQISMNEKFTDVDFGAFMASISPTPEEPQQLTGRITGALTVVASGHNTQDLKATSNGRTEFSITNGVLNGINVMETVRNIVAVANKEATVPDEPDRTEFRKLSGSAQINQGVLSNNDLEVVMPLMRVSGAGSLDLNTTAIDYRVGANVVQEGDIPLEKELRFISDYTLPLYISGTMAAPIVDKNRSIQDVVKQYAKKRVKDALLDRLGLGDKEEAPTPSGEVPAAEPPSEAGTDAEAPVEPEPQLTPEEQLEQKKEELKDELDEKLKDKLKDVFGG